jgi:hypothetical protein
MAKAVIIALDVTIPDTVQDQVATVTIAGTVYAGKVSAIVTYTPPAVSAPPAVLKLSANGLQVVP